MIHPKDAHLDGIPGALTRTKVKKSKAKSKGEKEETIQKKAENYCTVKGLRFIRIPDTAYSVLFGTPGVKPHVKALLSSYLKGIPDMTPLKPYKKYNLALLLEIKKKGGKLSQGQKNFHKGLNVVTCYGWDEVKEAIDEFVNYDE